MVRVVSYLRHPFCYHRFTINVTTINANAYVLEARVLKSLPFWRLAAVIQNSPPCTTVMASSIELINPKAESVRRAAALQVCKAMYVLGGQGLQSLPGKHYWSNGSCRCSERQSRYVQVMH